LMFGIPVRGGNRNEIACFADEIKNGRASKSFSGGLFTICLPFRL
jgi:hypothetical protein